MACSGVTLWPSIATGCLIAVFGRQVGNQPQRRRERILVPLAWLKLLSQGHQDHDRVVQVRIKLVLMLEAPPARLGDWLEDYRARHDSALDDMAPRFQLASPVSSVFMVPPGVRDVLSPGT